MDHFDVTLADRRKPWDVTSWSAGQQPIAQQYATAAEMLEAAGIAGMNVRKMAESVTMPDGTVIMTGRYSNVTHDGKVLGTGLSDRYVTLQAEDAFGFGDAIVDAGGANWERAGLVRHGETIFGCMEITHLEINVPGDDGGALKPYLLIVNSFGGWTPYMAKIAFIRPVCINTFEAAKGTKTQHSFTMRHTSSLDGRIAQARDAIGITFQHAEEVRELTTALATTKIVTKQVNAILAQLWPSSTKGKLSPTAQAVSDLYDTSETLQGIRGTRWGVLNAISEYTDHVAKYDDPEARGLSLMLETASHRKDRALQLLLPTR